MYVVDTSAIIDGKILSFAKNKEVKIVVPRAAIAELEANANSGKEKGILGLNVVKKLRHIADVSIKGDMPAKYEIEDAKKGAIDAKIRSIAKLYSATLVTSDKVQALAAEAEGIDVVYLEKEKKKLYFEKYFESNVMSVHIKEGVEILKKIGRPGEVKLKREEKIISREEAKRIVDEVIEAAENTEIDASGASVYQLGNYRIVITEPPFSDKIEITIVRPIKKTELREYSISKQLMDRINREAEGIVVCGEPGSGKSTFASALAEYYAKKGKIVKTMETPKDMQVGKEITQYGKLDGSFENTKDILLLVRPDYTFYDEMRKKEDFEIYADLRMAGVGLVGIVHAKKPIDAIQRFIRRIDLGLIAQVIDTVIFIKGGNIAKVYTLLNTVKVPYGMKERDLARPVVLIYDFEKGKEEYEIYKFGDETVVQKVKAKEFKKKKKKKRKR